MRRPITILKLFAAICVFTISTAAFGQDVDSPFPSNLFEPAPGPRNFPATESPELGDDMKPSVGMYVSYQYRSMSMMGCEGATCSEDIESSGGAYQSWDLVKSALVSDFLFSFNFLKRFQVGLAVPLYIWQNGRHTEVVTNGSGVQWASPADDPYNSYGVVGDIRIHLKGRILGNENSDGFALSAAVITALPMSAWTGQGEGYTGATSVSVTAPQIIAGYRFKSLRAAVNLGFLWRQKEEFYSAEIGHSMKYAGAVGYLFNIRPEVFGIELFAELYGNKSFVSENFSDLDSAPLLFNGGAHINVKEFAFTLAAGGGIITSVGVPQVQGIFGFAWNPVKDKPDPNSMVTEWDLDGDGLENESDECPQEAEDFDSFQDEDGCADNDNDKDGIQDGYDSCANEAEDKDGFRDDDGCPDMDHDEDGVKEPGDKCPEAAEDYDMFEDEDGCPEDDNDKDGILDGQGDACPLLAEDKDGNEDTDGCPELDDDNDGVPDTADKCPTELETLNGFKDDDGCPDKGDVLVRVGEEQFDLMKKVDFKGKSSTIAEESFQILDIIAYVIAGNTALRLSVASHTDARGTAEENLALTKSRAEEIRAYLVKHGVALDRIETVGYGAEQPLESNKKTAGRKANNRVDFRIIRPMKKVKAEAAVEESDETMDFTEGEGGEDTMDFSIDEKQTEEMEMDFSEEETE